MQGEKQGEEENRVKKTEDSSFSLLSHFWSTFRSPFSKFYIPFQISGSQESNASNHVQFGAKMRKIWPLEDNCSRLVRNSHNTLKFAQHLQLVRSLCETLTTLTQHLQLVQILCETRTTLAQHSHSPCVVRIFLCFSTHAPPTSQIFLA